MDRGKVQKIALERIYRLAELVRGEKEKKLRRRWIELMKLASMRNRARIPKELKQEFREELKELKEKNENRAGIQKNRNSIKNSKN